MNSFGSKRNNDGILFMFREFGTYLLPLEELRPIPRIEMILPGLARYRPDPAAQEGLPGSIWTTLSECWNIIRIGYSQAHMSSLIKFGKF